MRRCMPDCAGIFQAKIVLVGEGWGGRGGGRGGGLGTLYARCAGICQAEIVHTVKVPEGGSGGGRDLGCCMADV